MSYPQPASTTSGNVKGLTPAKKVKPHPMQKGKS